MFSPGPFIIAAHPHAFSIRTSLIDVVTHSTQITPTHYGLNLPWENPARLQYDYDQGPLTMIGKVAPTTTQPFYNHSGLLYHHPQRVKNDNTVAKVELSLRLSSIMEFCHLKLSQDLLYNIYTGNGHVDSLDKP